MSRTGRRLSAVVIGLGLLSFLAGRARAVPSPPPETAISPAAMVSASPLTWIGEPQAGFGPWQAALQHAKTGVEVNQYLLTDTAYVQALIQVAQRGIPVQVIVAANPVHDAAAVPEERQLFAGTRVRWHRAPGRFDQPYATDHAKYLIVNPGRPNALAILGSPNGTASAFGGWNAEAAIETTEPAITQALTAVFRADWRGTAAGPTPRKTLVVSPGAEPALRSMLAGTGPVDVATEELGDVPALYAALARHGANARLLIPPQAVQSAAGREWAGRLDAAGVHIRILATPYVHAKLLITAHQTWVGSQNWSEPSLMNNREVGLITANAAIHRAAMAWFNGLWRQAHPLP